jgi:hypothetical protein
MKRWLPVITGLLLAALWMGTPLSPAWAQGRGQGFRPCPYVPYKCPVSGLCKPFDATGTVAQVLAETLESSMYPGMALLVTTKSQGTVHVHLGPVWYLERQEVEFNPGDQVQVKGMAEPEKGGKLSVIAFEILKGTHVLKLRDAQGYPNWEAWRQK